MSQRFHIIPLLATVLGLLGSANAFSQEAGKLVLAVGSVEVERQGQRMPLKRGDAVQAGDLIVVGERSNAQVRFSDASLIALRAGSQFRIEAYRYAEGRNDARMEVTLVKGGLRAVTGLIGRQQPDAFSTRTPTATVGIRGTHFALRHCEGECVNPQGQPEPDGTYGAVNEGTIFASNAGGTADFTQHQYFYIPDANTPPRRLISPPNLLDDRPIDTRGLTPTRIPSESELQAPAIRQPGNTQVPTPENRFQPTDLINQWSPPGSVNEQRFPETTDDFTNNNFTATDGG